MKHLILVSLLSSGLLMAEAAPSTTTGATRAVTPATPSNFFGMVELRPSWTFGKGAWGTENTLQMGYQMTPDNSVDYIQYFTTNLYNPTGPSQLGLLGEEGFVRGRFNNLQVSPRTGVSVGYEARLYLPTKPAQRKAGLITAMRNYVNFTKVVSPKATVLVQALAATYAYERGASSASGTFTANPLVEPRLYVVPMFQLTPKTTLNFPVMFWATMHHNVPGADKSNRTTFSAAIWPEVYYMVAPKTQIGVSYYSGNFVDGFQTALTQGTFQAILQQAI